MKLEKIYPLDVDRAVGGMPRHFIIIGNGGTGGYLIPNVARIASVHNVGKSSKLHHQISLADPDVVEDKNLVRQNFITSDVNKSKADVMASRYSNAFGIQIGVQSSFIESADALLKLMNIHPHCVPVVIGAVDNNRTRQMIAELFYSKKKTFFWLDSGNEEYNGQVVCGFNYSARPNWDSTIPQRFYMPCVTDIFPDIMEDKGAKFVTELSCAERAVSHPQSIATNITAATILFDYCNILVNSSVMGGLRSNAVTFSVLNNSFRPYPNTKEQLELRYIAKESKKEVAAAAG